MSRMKPWREAASVILFSKRMQAAKAQSACNYQILMLRRHSKSDFMPNAYVFPGGVSAKADFDPNWIGLFDRFGKKDFRDVLASASKTRPMMMQPQPDDGLPRDLAFRITAIRETFEESGIFLQEKGNQIPAEELGIYRPQVHMDASSFLNMCQDYGVVPDIWGLYEYRDWLTPLGRYDKGGRRFDTIFYTAFVDDAHQATMDEVEITDLCWTDPESILDQAKNQKLWLAPPQVYELNVVKACQDIQSQKEDSMRRNAKGVETWMPVFIKCKDGRLSILPGDELYPDEPDYEGKEFKMETSDLTMGEMNVKYPRTNRVALYSMHDVELFVSIEV